MFNVCAWAFKLEVLHSKYLSQIVLTAKLLLSKLFKLEFDIVFIETNLDIEIKLKMKSMNFELEIRILYADIV